MKNLKLYLVISISINVLLAYMILKPVPKNTDLEHVLIDRIRKEYRANEERILRDSLRVASRIKVLTNKVSKIQIQRENDRSYYQLELSKIANLSTDSSYFAIIDSIKQVCCSSTGR